MEYIKLVAGAVLLIIFAWVFMKNRKRKGFIHSIFRFDTAIGIIAGLYLVITSVHSLWG